MKKSLQPSKNEKSNNDILISSLKNILSSEDNIFDMPHYFLDTGNYGLNYIISGKLDGGYHSGLVTELFGDPSTGKSLLMMKAVAGIQELGGIAIVNDVERRWDWDFAKTHGVVAEDVIKAYPQTIEELSTHTDKLLDEIIENAPNVKLLFIFDSAASISTEWEMETLGAKEDQGKRAKGLKAMMRVIPKKLAETGAIMIVSNHLIADKRITYGNNQVTPGGKGITFQASVRVEMRKPEFIVLEGKERPIGATLKMKAVKTSVCPPMGTVAIDVLWNKGINKYSGLLDIAVDLDIIEKAGAWYKYNDKAYRSTDMIKIVTETDILQDERWAKPYFLEEI